MVSCAKLYHDLTGQTHVYSIMPIDNIPSVLSYGILSHEEAKKLPHLSVADPDVQDRRENVVLPNGAKLHQYANLYFSFWNPMLSRVRENNENICILGVSLSVLDIDGCAITDRNAATSLARFYSPQYGLNELDFEKIHMSNWNDDNVYVFRDNRAIKCAEVLVPGCVPESYIMGAYVVSEAAKNRLIDAGFDKKIIVKPSYFF